MTRSPISAWVIVRRRRSTQSRPMRTSGPITAPAPITVPVPISARGPITAAGIDRHAALEPRRRMHERAGRNAAGLEQR